jgi:hypothetical protein
VNSQVIKEKNEKREARQWRKKWAKENLKTASIHSLLTTVGLPGLSLVEDIAPENIPRVRTCESSRPTDIIVPKLEVKIAAKTFGRLNFLLMKTATTLYEKSLGWCNERKQQVYIAS